MGDCAARSYHWKKKNRTNILQSSQRLNLIVWLKIDNLSKKRMKFALSFLIQNSLSTCGNDKQTD